MISTKPDGWNLYTSIRDNLNHDSNVTEESESHAAKNSSSKYAIDARILSQCCSLPNIFPHTNKRNHPHKLSRPIFPIILDEMSRSWWTRNLRQQFHLQNASQICFQRINPPRIRADES
jgi:hypothetical protein